MAAAAPSEEGASMLSKLGLSAQTLTPDLAKQLGIEAEKGVVITDVNEGSLASLAGLHKGDVIVEADRQSVSNVDELEQVLAKAKDKDNVLLLVKKQGGSLFVVLQMK
jgi:serine protease Do